MTGSQGFLGRHFVRTLWDDHDVWCCDIRSTKPTDARDVFRTTDAEFDLVIHCAAIVGGREVIDRRPMEQAVDFELDAGLFRWALENTVRKVVYFSSSAVYPVSLQHADGRDLCEDDVELVQPELPDALYGWTKLTGERLAFHAKQHGLDVLVVRPFSGYGEDQDDCYPFPAIMDRARRRFDPFPIWGSGRQIRDFIHVDDIVDSVLSLLNAGFDGPVNIGTGRPTTMSELALMAARHVGFEPSVSPMTDAPQGVMRRVADTTVLSDHFAPRVSLEEGIARALKD